MEPSEDKSTNEISLSAQGIKQEFLLKVVILHEKVQKTLITKVTANYSCKRREVDEALAAETSALTRVRPLHPYKFVLLLSEKNVKYIYFKKGLYRGTGQFNIFQQIGFQSFKERKDRTQSIPFWKGVLWNPPETSRQTKFLYPHRGLNKNFF